MPKKTVAKKKTTKKKVTKKKLTKDAPEECYFVLCNGQPVKNVRELADVLEHLRDDVFNHHVNPDKNDFAMWIHHVFEDIELAKKLADVKDKTQTRLVLYKHIVHKI